MSAHSINQTLAGIKVNTRRVVSRVNTVGVARRQLSKAEWSELPIDMLPCGTGVQHRTGIPFITVPTRKKAVELFPRIRPGDTIRIKEGWAVHVAFNDLTPTQVAAEYKNNPNRDFPRVYYKAASPESALRGRWRSPLYMPKWASRIRLLVKSVRFEWLQDISEEDCESEGAPYMQGTGDTYATTVFDASHRNGFIVQWNSLNQKRGYPFEDNPLVLRYEYEVIR
jgi:hypothetical protein